MPACLIRRLLLIAGIEPNPGPPTWSCAVCSQNCPRGRAAVMCNGCKQWCHFRKNNNCSDLTKLKDWSALYTCRKCKTAQAVPLMNVPLPNLFARTSTAQDGSSTSCTKLRVLQFNCNGLSGKCDELIDWLLDKKIHVAALQETKLTGSSKPPKTADYTLVRRDRGHNSGGGLAFLVHKSVQFTTLSDLPPDPHVEAQAIKVGNISIVNVYIPPTSSCVPGYSPTITRYLPTSDALVLGDLNAHDALWNSKLSDTRGADLSSEISQSDFGVLNEDTPTRLPKNGSESSPDVSLASMSLMALAEWSTYAELGSDHLPIVISLQTNDEIQWSQTRNFVNFTKARWDDFLEETEDRISKLPPPDDVYQAEKKLRRIVNIAAKHAIPNGRILNVTPSMPSDAAELVRERNALRQNDPSSDRISELNREIEFKTQAYRAEKWREYVSSFDGRTQVGKLFKAIKSVNGGCTTKNNQAINFHGKPVLKAKALAKLFNQQYSSVVPHKSNKNTRKLTRRTKKLSLDDAPAFTAEQTLSAIKRCKPSKAIGPDGISSLHVKHLGPYGIRYLTQIFNLSVRKCKIPSIWKSSIIVPLLKPGKPANDSKSYRPVSLLCPAIKILERLLLPILTEQLSIPDHQHGFRKLHSTVTALHDLNHDIAGGFNEKKPPHRTVLLQIDLSKAFDMVNHDKLISDVLDTALPSALKRWFVCYLRGRESKVRFRECLSSSRNVRTGVPQGAVTSPLLFNFYLSGMPEPPPGVKIVQYADDISIYATGPTVSLLADAINEYAPRLTDYLHERGLIVSPEKSSVTLFTPDTHQARMRPDIKLGGVDVPLERNPKLLGVVHDTMYTFTEHVSRTVSKAKKKVNVLKALAGTTWGQQKEPLVHAYKAVCRSTLEYGAPIWSNTISDTNWRKLQTVQNEALRVATGCHRMSGIDHLHEETKVIPLRRHSEMMTKQYLHGCYRPNHPANKHVNDPDPPRRMKRTVRDYEESVRPYVIAASDGNALTDCGHKRGISRIHTDTVTRVIGDYAPNRVLNRKAPNINSKETELPRNARRVLAQLRSGFCSILKSYQHRIDDRVQDVCPDCGASPHDVSHIFNCTQNPTDLTPEDLWLKPRDVASFIGLLN